jgi:hypothetical protein
MNIKTLKRFLERNPIDKEFECGICESDNTLNISKKGFHIEINIDLIKSVGLSYTHIFFETSFGRYSFLRKSNFDLLGSGKRNVLDTFYD